MRIVYVTIGFPFGTRETFLIPELRELRAQGHQVLIVPLRPTRGAIHPDAAELLTCARHSPLLSVGVVRDAAAESIGKPHATLRVMRLLFHTRGLRALAINIAVIPKSFWLAKISRDWGADHIHAYWASSAATAALIAGELTGIPWSFTGHRHDLAADNLLGEKTRHAAFVRMISASSIRLLQSATPDVPSKVSVLHLGIPIPELSGRVAKKRRPVVLCPANLVAVKGHNYLLDAMAMLRGDGVDIELWLAGDGELRGRIQQKIRELRLEDNVRLLGHIAHHTLLSLYRDGKVEIVALPSVDLGNGEREAIPVSLMEAMAYAIPVVATDTGGIPELIGDGAGLLVEPANPRKLAHAIATLGNNSALRSSVGLAGRKRVEQSFEITHNVRDLAQRFAGSSRACANGQAQVIPAIERIASRQKAASS